MHPNICWLDTFTSCIFEMCSNWIFSALSDDSQQDQIAKDLLSGEEEETPSSADDLTPSVTSHTSDLFDHHLHSMTCPDTLHRHRHSIKHPTPSIAIYNVWPTEHLPPPSTSYDPPNTCHRHLHHITHPTPSTTIYTIWPTQPLPPASTPYNTPDTFHHHLHSMTRPDSLHRHLHSIKHPTPSTAIYAV